MLAVLAALVLVCAGLANLVAVDGGAAAVRQLVIGAVGVGLLAALWRVRVGLLGVLGWISYGVGIGMLSAVLVVGVAANGARAGSRSARSPSSPPRWSRWGF